MARDNPEQLKASLFETEQIDLAQYWQTIRRFQWRILTLAVLVTMLVAVLLLFVTPKYRAGASLLIEADQAKVLSIEEVYGLDTSRKEYFQTQYEVLRSRQIAQGVVEKLNLTEHPYFDPAQQPPSLLPFDEWKNQARQWLKEHLTFLQREQTQVATPDQEQAGKLRKVVDRFRANLSVVPVKNTQVVNIYYQSESPALSALITNTVAEVYIENYLEAKFAMTSKATSWMNESLASLRSKLDKAEKELAEFYEREKLVDMEGGVVGLTGDELQGLSQQLLQAQNRLEQSRALYEQVNLGSNDISSLARLPEVLNHNAIQNVRRAEVEAESKVSELARVYGPKHPTMISARAELESIRENFRNQVRELISGISMEYRSTQERVATLKKAVEEAKNQYRRISSLESEHQKLQREVDINRQLYNSFLTRLKETNEIEGFEKSNARVLDPAVVPTSPYKPDKVMVVVVTFAASLAVGAMLALLADAMYSGIRSVEDVERKLGQRVLGVLPRQKRWRRKSLPLRHYFDNKQHAFSESVRSLRTSLLLLNIDKSKRVIMVTSSMPEEGKTTTSINLAFAMGQLGKTLLIDGDLRRSAIARQFGFPGFQAGLANIIAGTHTMRECVVNDATSGIDIIGAGTSPSNPQEMLASERFGYLLKQLRERYEHIILDTAPTMAVSDAMVVANHCDSLIYVVKADATREKTINKGLMKFMQVGHRVDGIVLNQLDIKEAIKTGDYSAAYEQYAYGKEGKRA
ncbi:GumC family protein [Bowmanella dokdonensis]|uniref:non-specific protein-tyrosine kinase n=1 Tax=Bowmanella dokdonensis TaxID=751969 RepID=A0A939IND5_9ALTE|nr:polysaccharide biosynthesis tyrosine autokinase [Bowmanella dokdonensis]MBN7824700.1 polysaccharide biosynthesis tyrosine autokinase [Bowmanella dokdonensis]